MDLSILSHVAAAAPATTAAKAWSSALTTLITAGVTWGVAYATGSADPTVAGAFNEAANNLFLVTLTAVVPSVLSYYITYIIPNKTKGQTEGE
jgi:hypothetical protein